MDVHTWLRDLRRRRAGRGKKLSRSTIALSAGLAALLAVFAWALAYLAAAPTGRSLTYDQVVQLVAGHRVVQADFRDQDAVLVGLYRSDVATAEQPFVLPYPKSDAITADLAQRLAQSGARVTFDRQSVKSSVKLVTTFLLPLVVLADLFALLLSVSRGSGGGIGEVLNFSSIGQKRRRRGQLAPVTFDDVAGATEAIEELREVRDYLADPTRYEALGAQPPKGVLLFGPPGCGKTLLAKAVAGEAGVPFFSVAGAEFVESLVGVGAARVRDLFRRVREVAPAIVFIDELDAAGRRRGSGGSGGGSDEREQTLNQLLVEMDGFDVSSGIVVMAATNRPDIIDPALLRPGRFDRHITVEQPDVHGREDILRLHATRRVLAAGVDFARLARRTPGFTGADLANVINEAALLTVRQGRDEIDTPELEEAVQRVLSGPQRRGRVLAAEEKQRVAIHESGHAVVAAALGYGDDVHRLSILPRNRTLGATMVTTDADAGLLTRDQLTKQLCLTLAGTAAETRALGQPSTGAEDDIEKATAIARAMVTQYAMSPEVGPVRLAPKSADIYLSSDVGQVAMSEQLQNTIEVETRKLVEAAIRRADELLARAEPQWRALAQELETEEMLEGAALELLLAQVPPDGVVEQRPARRSVRRELSTSGV